MPWASCRRNCWLEGDCTSSTVRPRVLPVDAYTSAKMVDRAVVLISGSVWPQVKRPHSGWPYLAHPCASVLSASKSCQAIGFLGQPRASAIGFHIAITTGVRTSGRLETATCWLPCSCLSTSNHALSDGVQTAGLSVPCLISVRASPDDLLIPSTTIGLPSTVGCVALNAA